MLNRTAESLFWIGRYMERAENHARLIDVYYHLQSDDFTGAKGVEASLLSDKWVRIVEALGSSYSFEQSYGQYDEESVLHYITMDRENTNSLVSCISNARNNLRTLREQAPTEMWDVLNGFYLWLKDQAEKELIKQSPHQFLSQIKSWCNMFNGCAQSVMPRMNEWHFLESGRQLERAENTLRIIHTITPTLAQGSLTAIGAYPYLQAVLKTMSGYQTYRRIYADNMSVEHILKFVIFNESFPRSLHYSLHKLMEHVRALELSDKQIKLSHERIVRQLGKLNAELVCLEEDELSLEVKKALTVRLLQDCDWIGNEMSKAFFLAGEVSA